MDIPAIFAYGKPLHLGSDACDTSTWFRSFEGIGKWNHGDDAEDVKRLNVMPALDLRPWWHVRASQYHGDCYQF